MVKRVIQMMYKEVRGLHQAAYVLALFAFGSQLLALVRDRMLAHQFGAGFELDIYYAAFRIPDLLYVLFASTLSVYVLIPFVVSRIKGEDATQAQALLGQVFSLFLLFYTALAAVVWLCAPYIVPVVFPGMTEHVSDMVTILRILLLQPLFLGISSLFGVVTQIGHRFVLYAISPLIYNLGIIGGIVFLYPLMGLQGLAYGVVLGAVGHMAVQFPLVRSSSLSFWVSMRLNWGLLFEVLCVSIPRAITLAMHQVVLLVLVSIAGLMTVGSVAVFQFAYNLQSVPLAIIGASYSIAAFPLLADLYVQNKKEAFSLHVVTALRHIIFWSVPVIGLLIVLRAQMVRVVLGSGAFDWSDTRLTAAVMALLSVSLFAQAVNLLLVRVFYAGGHTRTPFLVTLFGSLCAIGFTVTLYHSYSDTSVLFSALESMLRIENVDGSEIISVAIGYSAAIILQTIVLLLIAARKFALPLRWVPVHMSRSLFAAVFGGFCAYSALNFFVFGIDDETFVGIFLQGLMGATAGILGIVSAYYVTGSPELLEIYKSLKGRKVKTEIVISQDDVL
ncbi:MAG: putative peptidoglycan lipid II flippase [Acidimicrobiales bacterium]|jgi:putative peptidoglycan lipid II flippase